MTKELARKRGLDVAIMPKPYSDRTVAARISTCR